MSKPFHKLSAYLFCLALVMGAVSCQTAKSTSYFQTIQKDTTLSNTVSKNFDLAIKPDDLLAISISSASADLSALFNAVQGGSGASAAGGGYLVDKNGNVQLYKLGDVRLAGLTRHEARIKLQQELSPYLKDPVVTVRFQNQRIIVLGEVGRPGPLTFATDQISLIEALGQSGDLKENARRDKILIIRQTENGKEFHYLNLLDHSVFNSPYYYLQSEDVIYVKGEEKKKESLSGQQVISYVLSGISILTLILSRIK